MGQHPTTRNVAAGANQSNLPGLQTGPAPWPPVYNGLRARLAALRLPPIGAESFHVHAHLSFFIGSQTDTIPADVGISAADGLGSPLHTHDASGIIHIEAAHASDAFTLGAFFVVWGVKFTTAQLGSYPVRVFINGQPAANPTTYVLHNHDNIVIGYGPPGSFPTTVPFAWPSGL